MQCVCGLEYRNFRTGLTFADVRQSMWVESSDFTQWRHKTRRMVLGHWHELKLALWRSHCAECEYYEREYPEEFNEACNAVGR